MRIRHLTLAILLTAFVATAARHPDGRATLALASVGYVGLAACLVGLCGCRVALDSLARVEGWAISLDLLRGLTWLVAMSLILVAAMLSAFAWIFSFLSLFCLAGGVFG